MRNALNAMLYQTGEQSNNFMMVLATNRPSDLDAAVVDRMDETLEFDVPEEHERHNMIKLYYDTCIRRTDLQIKGDQKTIMGWCTRLGQRVVRRITHGPCPPMIECEEIVTKDLEDAARRTEGFSGREISKLVLSLQGAAYGRDDCVLSKAMFADVLDWKVKEHSQKAKMAEEVEPSHKSVSPPPSKKSSSSSSAAAMPSKIPKKCTPATPHEKREPMSPATPQLPM